MIRRLIEQYREKRKFTAEKCRSHQEEELEKRASTIIEDIRAYINFKVDNTNEKAIIYSINHTSESQAIELVEHFYKERGFKVFKTKFPELGDAEFLVISWIL